MNSTSTSGPSRRLGESGVTNEDLQRTSSQQDRRRLRNAIRTLELQIKRAEVDRFKKLREARQGQDNSRSSSFSNATTKSDSYADITISAATRQRSERRESSLENKVSELKFENLRLRDSSGSLSRASVAGQGYGSSAYAPQSQESRQEQIRSGVRSCRVVEQPRKRSKYAEQLRMVQPLREKLGGSS
ncbi:MAG: hypothetical protein L6R41_004878 [Letrouitia leprolyta]|nr:MAG: hypothetical protein L6R41_004878 [Letrouitia leprolyta]